MKKKLFYAVAATVALAACTAEEDLQVKQTQTSPIKFSLSMDDELGTRTAWGGNNGYKINWTEGDLMSLFHGGNLNATDDKLSGMENAIYEAKAGDGESDLVFTTASMIKAGQAIMVFPADTTFTYQKEDGLFVSISADQNSDYVMNHLPFMSEGIEIDPYTGKAAYNEAGYGRTYPIRMKQVGTTMDLTPVYTGEAKNIIDAMADKGEVEPITVSKIVLTNKNGFNTMVKVGLESNQEDKARWNSFVSHNGWNERSVVEPAGEERKPSLSFSGKDLEKARFLLLPQYTDDISGDTELVPLTKTAEGKPAESSIKVYTYYGSVTLDNNDGNVFYQEKVTEKAPKRTVEAGLNDYVVGFTTKTKTPGSVFTGEMAGAHLNRKVDVDLTKLDMSDLHIKSNKQLQDVLLVWEAIMDKTKAVQLTIDGDTKGRFELSMDNVDRLQKAPWAGKVSLIPCKTKGEECTAVVLTQRDASVKAGKADEVPAVDFIGAQSLDTKIVLGEGNWTWEGKKYVRYIQTIENEGILTLKKEVDNTEHNWAIYTEGGIVNSANATINVEGVVEQKLNLLNLGTINIPAGAELRAYGKNITNDATGLDELVFAGAANEAACGKIYNSGVLGVTAVTNGEIYNYGYIKNNKDAKTYITQNETKTADFGTEFDAASNETSNKIGVIELATATDNISVSNATEQGFIKYHWDEAAGSETGVYGTPGDGVKYNYLIVDKNITFKEQPVEVKFIEINSQKEVVITTKDINVTTTKDGKEEVKKAPLMLSGLILPTGQKANLKEGNELKTDGSYIKGTLYVGGIFTTGSLQTYFGGKNSNGSDNGDRDNIVAYGLGAVTVGTVAASSGN